MPNIPTRERPNMPPRPRMPQNISQNVPQRNLPPSRNVPPRIVYDPRKAPPRNVNYKQLQRPPVRGQNERVNPVRPTKKALPSTVSPRAKKQTKKKYKYKERTVTQEFILGFVVGMLIFGIAAIFICTALIGLFT